MANPALTASLQLLADRGLDPGERLYARLFAEHPEAVALFVRDVDGAIRGNMLAQAIEALLDFGEQGVFGRNLIASERINHEGLGVAPELFTRFYELLHEVCRDMLGQDWTPEMSADWSKALADLLGKGGAPTAGG